MSLTVRAADELDPTLEPKRDDANAISRVFRDMVVVQRKAKDKAKHFLFNSSASFDFSDGPTTMYGLNLDLGYAFSDHWEVYLSAIPAFVANDRDIVSRVQSLPLANGSNARIAYAVPQYAYGINVLWIPAYGKDSWGPHSIVRSDTFFKLGGGNIHYDLGDGVQVSFGIGKTFFLSRWFNLRVSAGARYLQSIVDNEKKGYIAGIIEAGSIWYF